MRLLSTTSILLACTELVGYFSIFLIYGRKSLHIEENIFFKFFFITFSLLQQDPKGCVCLFKGSGLNNQRLSDLLALGDVFYGNANRCYRPEAFLIGYQWLRQKPGTSGCAGVVPLDSTFLIALPDSRI